MENLNQFNSSTGEPVAPRFTDTEVNAMLGLPAENQLALVRGGASQIQEQNLPRGGGYDLYSQVLMSENSPISTFGISNESNGNNQLAIKTTERSALPPSLQIDHTVNSLRASNPAWLQQNQFSAVNATGSQYYHNHMQYAPIGNPNPNFQSQVAGHTGYWDQLVDPTLFPRSGQSMTFQMRQVPPSISNKVPTPLLTGPVPESSSARAHVSNPFANAMNQNARPMVPSADQANALIPLQNQTPNLLMGRDLRREGPMEATKIFKLGEGRVERSWDAGEGSSAKRLKTISPPTKEGATAGPAAQDPNNAAENPKLLDLINSTGNTGGVTINSLYDPAFEALGLAVDPHIRLFEALAARGEKGYRMYH